MIPHECDLRVSELTTAQLHEIWANRRALENAVPPPAMEWEQRERSIEDRAYSFVQWARGLGLDEDIIGADLTRKLLKLGYSEDETAAVLRDVGVTWHNRTREDRLVAVAIAMLKAGYDRDTVREAIRPLVDDGS